LVEPLKLQRTSPVPRPVPPDGLFLSVPCQDPVWAAGGFRL